MIEIAIKKLTDTARLPKFAHQDDACADLYADTAVEIPPGERKLVKTGLSFQLQPGWEAQIRPRSGLALKQGIMICNSPGTIDAGYRGDVGIILYNTSNQVFIFNQHDRIAQVAFRQVPQVELVEVGDIEDTTRGAGGFGSTGISAR